MPSIEQLEALGRGGAEFRCRNATVEVRIGRHHRLGNLKQSVPSGPGFVVASKAAIIAVSESLALYLHPKGVRVSCFCPGPVMTGIAGQMRNWTPDAPMRGPGRQYRLMSAEQAAAALADGMAAGRVIIPTDETVWEDIRAHAASPDAFIQAKIEAFASGDHGLPGG